MILNDLIPVVLSSINPNRLASQLCISREDEQVTQPVDFLLLITKLDFELHESYFKDYFKRHESIANKLIYLDIFDYYSFCVRYKDTWDGVVNQHQRTFAHIDDFFETLYNREKYYE